MSSVTRLRHSTANRGSSKCRIIRRNREVCNQGCRALSSTSWALGYSSFSEAIETAPSIPSTAGSPRHHPTFQRSPHGEGAPQTAVFIQSPEVTVKVELIDQPSQADSTSLFKLCTSSKASFNIKANSFDADFNANLHYSTSLFTLFASSKASMTCTAMSLMQISTAVQHLCLFKHTFQLLRQPSRAKFQQLSSTSVSSDASFNFLANSREANFNANHSPSSVSSSTQSKCGVRFAGNRARLITYV